MYITPLLGNDSSQRKSFKGTFKPAGQVLKSPKITETIEKAAENKNVRNVYKGLSVLAVSLASELALFAEKNKEVINGLLDEFDVDKDNRLRTIINSASDSKASGKESAQVDIAKLIEEKPERELYLKVTSYFPNLDEKYRQMLSIYSKEPENERNKFVLSSTENLFKMFTSSNEKLMYMKPYLDILNNKYSNCLDGIADNLASTVMSGNSPMSYLTLLRNEAISENDINRWAKFRNLSYNEFLITSELSDEALGRLNKLKDMNHNFTIKRLKKFDDDRFDIPTYAFKLGYTPEDLGIARRLKTIAMVHEAIYGELYLREAKDSKDDFLMHDIQNELVDNILKDRRMDSTYNFVKFLKPEALKKFKYTSDEVKFLTREDKDFHEIKRICSQVLMNLDFEDPKLKELCEVLNDEKMFTRILSTRHARIRFVTRFVLKDNYKPVNLKEETKAKLNIFLDELKPQLENCNIFCYMHSKGTAPQFYLGKSKLGKYIKITLNGEGSIHTLYEDFNKERKYKEAKENTLVEED